ncbi:reverse transcriptase domain-containing protein [Tanacetum coccineum]
MPTIPLAVPLDGLHFDDKHSVCRETIEITDREVKRLSKARNPISQGSMELQERFLGPEFTWEREDQFRKKYPHLFTKTAPSSILKGCYTSPKSLREHSSPISTGFQDPIILPVEQSGNIIDSRDIWLIKGVGTFQGLKSEKPIHHVKHFLSLVDNIQADRAIINASRLHFFHFTLKGDAKKWLDRIPPSQITTWEQLASKFLDKFFPPGCTSTIRDTIIRFYQKDNKPIKDAWIRFQDLIRHAPHHGVNKCLLVQIFYDNISPDDQNGLNHFVQYHFSQLNEDEGCNGIKEYVRYQDNTCEEPALMNISYISELIKPTLEGQLKKAQETEGEEGPEWVVRSKFEDKLANFMLKKHLHAKGLGEMLNYQRSEMHNQFSQILAMFEKIKTPTPKFDAQDFAITTRSGVATRDPPYLTPLNTIHVNLPFLEAMIHMPKGAKELALKRRRPREFHSAMLIRPLAVKNALADLGAIDHDGKWIEMEKEHNPKEIQVVSFYPRQEKIKPLEWKALENRLKPSITEPPKLELKELPEHLEYALLQGNDQLPIVIYSALSAHEKTKLLETNLVLNWEKCHFMVKEGIVLGHKVSGAGIKVDREKIKSISKLPYPMNIKAIRSFLGHAGFYRRFIKDFSKIALPMTQLLMKDAPFFFLEECIQAFDMLKQELTQDPIMIKPDWSLLFEIMCDASDYAIGMVLGQRKDKHF